MGKNQSDSSRKKIKTGGGDTINSGSTVPLSEAQQRRIHQQQQQTRVPKAEPEDTSTYLPAKYDITSHAHIISCRRNPGKQKHAAASVRKEETFKLDSAAVLALKQHAVKK